MMYFTPDRSPPRQTPQIASVFGLSVAIYERALSTAPEAEKSRGLMRFPVFSSAKLALVSLGRKALNSGV